MTWSEWTFENFLEVLGKWTINNPLPAESKFQRERRERRERMHALNSTGGTDSHTVYVAIVRVKVTKHSAVIKLIKMLGREGKSWLPRGCASIAQGPSTGLLIVKALQFVETARKSITPLSATNPPTKQKHVSLV